MKPDIQIEDYGTSLSNPVLLSSIRAGYVYCDKLRNLDEDLEYSRRGSDLAPGFDKPVDAYDFKHFGKVFCTVYIYAYHSENIEEVPQAFLDLEEEDDLIDNFLEQYGLTEEEGTAPGALVDAMIRDVHRIYRLKTKDYRLENSRTSPQSIQFLKAHHHNPTFNQYRDYDSGN